MPNRYTPGEYMVPEDGAWSRNDDDMVAKKGLPLIDSGELTVSDPIGTTTSMEYIYVDGVLVEPGTVSIPPIYGAAPTEGIGGDGVYFLGAASLPDTSEPSDDETSPQ